MIRILCLGVILLTGMWNAWGQTPAATPAPARVAVVGGTDAADLVSLITTELSDNPVIVLVERSDLAKVGDEAKVQQLAGGDAVSLGKLIGADGLVFISKGPDGFQVRLTAAGLGYALMDERFEVDTDLPHLAHVIAQRVADYAPKLKLRPGEAIPLSVLNLRADVPTPVSYDLERKLSLLLESQLAAMPKVVILERRHSSAVKFERLLTSTDQALLQGASVVDGTVTIPAEGKDGVTVHLRLRSAHGDPVLFDVQGTMKDLPGLVRALATAIGTKLNVTADPASWQPQAEAAEYFREAVWGSQHNALEAALEALDSAELLGADPAEVIHLRVPVLCGIATGSIQIMTGDYDTPDDPHPEARIDAILRAFPDEVRYENENMVGRIKETGLGDAYMTIRREGVARAAGSLLTMLDVRKDPRAEEIRSVFRDYVGYDPLHGKFPKDVRTGIRNADALSKTEEEEKAYYQALLASPANTATWRSLRMSLYRDSYCARFYPKVDGTDYERYIAYLKFLQGLYDGPCRLNALLFYASAIMPPQMQADAGRSYDQALTDQRDNLLATHQLAPYLAAAFELEHGRESNEIDPQLITLLHFLLQRSDQIDGAISQAWDPSLFPAAEAPALWKEFQMLEAKSTGPMTSLFSTQMRQKYLSRFSNQNAVADTLEVNRFWSPPNAPGKPEFTRSPVQASNGIWIGATYMKHDTRPGTATGVIYRVALDGSRPDSFTTDATPMPDFYPEAMAATTDALYVYGCIWPDMHHESLRRFDLSTQNVEAHDVPTLGSLFTVGDHLYMTLSSIGLADMESGIALWDEKTSTPIVLASNRRRPALNQFDDRSYYSVLTLFAGCEGKPWVSIGFGEVYAVEDKPGSWPRVIPSGALNFSHTEGSRTILCGSNPASVGAEKRDIVFKIDADKPNPQLLLGEPGELFGSEMIGKPEPLPPQPEWSQNPVWQQPPEDGPYSSEYGFRGDELYGFVLHTKTQQAELQWYRPGQPAPVRIPLTFKMSEDATRAIKRMEDDDDDPYKKQRLHNEVMRMYCTPQGPCFIAEGKGFWFLPYSDIDAYLKTSHN